MDSRFFILILFSFRGFNSLMDSEVENQRIYSL